MPLEPNHRHLVQLTSLSSPDPILFKYVPPIFEDRSHYALDLGCGDGYNTIWIASQGYVTDGMDVDRIALSTAQIHAQQYDIRAVNFLPMDLDNLQLRHELYDVVVMIRLNRRSVIPSVRIATRPGGRVIYQVYNTEHPTSQEHHFFRIGELVGYFSDWNIIYHTNARGITQLVAIKPDDPQESES